MPFDFMALFEKGAATTRTKPAPEPEPQTWLNGDLKDREFYQDGEPVDIERGGADFAHYKQYGAELNAARRRRAERAAAEAAAEALKKQNEFALAKRARAAERAKAEATTKAEADARDEQGAHARKWRL